MRSIGFGMKLKSYVSRSSRAMSSASTSVIWMWLSLSAASGLMAVARAPRREYIGRCATKACAAAISKKEITARIIISQVFRELE